MKTKMSGWLPVFIATDATVAGDGEEKAVRKSMDRFYIALNELFTGDLGPMKDIWSHGEDVTYMGPGGGLRIGWRQVLADWEAQADLKLGGKVTPEDVHVTVGRDLAVVHNYEKGENSNAEGRTQQVSIRATNLFRKEGGTWKMIGHHTDLLAYI